MEFEASRTKKLNSGVRFQGEGLEAREGDLVEFNYVCRRSNGYFVHSTVDQFSGESNPVVLPLDEKQIIKGLKEVLVGMKVGGKRRASVPPNVGYINEDLKPIPDEFGPRRSLLSHANETLIFEVQLLKELNKVSEPDWHSDYANGLVITCVHKKVHNQIVWTWDGPRQFLPENVRRLSSLPTFNADSYGGNLNSSTYISQSLSPPHLHRPF
ncbi:hypothetical protein QJS10_CPB15g01110 [Acorus calamus]|uniref:peptidylprolyl isomerase n=1 Tax=Acorus calamus TaxID=4465 RepID=A0AAV9D8Z2_ACOCL|nr:hypothetical protein QJS10_CPB15g01110 [Acorus calamus]